MKYHKTLYNLEEKTSLGANAVLLFLFLKEIKNAEEKVIISDYDLSKTLRLARQTIATTKKTLKEHGLIDYFSEKGKITTYTFPNNSTQKNPSQKPKIPTEKLRSNNQITNNPTFEEFMLYAQSLENYHSNLDFSLKEKYDTWAKNNWKTPLEHPISNWKQILKNNFSFLKPKHK